MPVGGSALGTMCTATWGMSVMRGTAKSPKLLCSTTPSLSVIAAPDVEGDVLVRLHRTEGLGNALQLDGECRISHSFPRVARPLPLDCGFDWVRLQSAAPGGWRGTFPFRLSADQNVAAGQVLSDM